MAMAPEREFSIDNLLVRIHFITAMISWTGLAPWEREFPFQVALYLFYPQTLNPLIFFSFITPEPSVE